MKFRAALLLFFALAGCTPSLDEAGPPPADYKDVIKANLPETPVKTSGGDGLLTHDINRIVDDFTPTDLVDPYKLHNVEISAPQPGRIEFIPGWRVCLRAELHLPEFHPDLSNPDKNQFVFKDKNNPYKGDAVYPDTRTYTDPKTWAYFFKDGTLQKIVPNDAPCDHYAYTPWPEMSDIGQKLTDKYLHPKWEYGNSYDYLLQADTAFADLISKNHYDLRFPYAGGTHAIIGVIKTPAGLKAELLLDRGLFSCTSDCKMQVRFDSDPIETMAFDHADGSEKSIIELPGSARVIERLQHAHSLVIEVSIANNGSKQFIFSTGGLTLANIGTVTTTQDPFAPASSDDGQNYDLIGGKKGKS